MFPSLIGSTTIPILEQVVGFTQARHEVLAGNVANADVPGYKTRDLSPELFEKNLQKAIEGRERQATSRSPGELVADGDRYQDFSDVKKSFKNILYHDKSDVSMEKQIVEISKNQSRHNLALAIMTNQFRLLQAAISERAG